MHMFWKLTVISWEISIGIICFTLTTYYAADRWRFLKETAIDFQKLHFLRNCATRVCPLLHFYSACGMWSFRVMSGVWKEDLLLFVGSTYQLGFLLFRLLYRSSVNESDGRKGWAVYPPLTRWTKLVSLMTGQGLRYIWSRTTEINVAKLAMSNSSFIDFSTFTVGACKPWPSPIF